MASCLSGFVLKKKKTLGVLGYPVMRIDLGEQITLPNHFESVDSTKKVLDTRTDYDKIKLN